VRGGDGGGGVLVCETALRELFLSACVVVRLSDSNYLCVCSIKTLFEIAVFRGVRGLREVARANTTSRLTALVGFGGFKQH